MKGIEIKEARIRAGLRQYQVAAQVGISPSKLSEIESGRKQPSRELYSRILEVIREA